MPQNLKVGDNFFLKAPDQLTFGPRCQCGQGYIPYWQESDWSEPQVIYPYCGACAIIRAASEDLQAQRRNENEADMARQKRAFEGGYDTDNPFGT